MKIKHLKHLKKYLVLQMRYKALYILEYLKNNAFHKSM